MASTAPQPSLERDAVKLDPQHYRVELENARVRVVRIVYGGRESSPMHQHPPGVVVFLSGGKFRFTFPDGRVEMLEKNAGEIMYFAEPWEHLPESLTDDSFEAVYVELRS